jgi:hypothetical protein
MPDTTPSSPSRPDSRIPRLPRNQSNDQPRCRRKRFPTQRKFTACSCKLAVSIHILLWSFIYWMSTK